MIQLVSLSSALAGDTAMAKKRKSAKERLMGARFRMLNEELYRSSSEDNQTLFEKDPEAFAAYHQGFRAQVQRWDQHPAMMMVSKLKDICKMKIHRDKPEPLTVVDLGCGEALIAKEIYRDSPANQDQGDSLDVRQKQFKGKGKKKTQPKKPIVIRSFDLVADNEYAEVGNIAALNLESNSQDVAIFSLSLMGNDHPLFIQEAARILKKDTGIMLVSEVGSRITSQKMFVKMVEGYGFKLDTTPRDMNYFVFFEFKRTDAEDTVPDEQTIAAGRLGICEYKPR
ncbi:methyltransferase-related protein [Kipferlia bialata]|uniref:Ribosomal RNA-processing protein 8 n=1 Tax=Kipferlia bialata TaxID=797122 RepID=A0A9K3D1F6_9EUKA|nr:methyltransferase-related protein [Kipferlia bialata]|eukprot:g9233.t1